MDSPAGVWPERWNTFSEGAATLHKVRGGASTFEAINPLTGDVGPQQADQGIPPMSPIGLDGQIGQQRAGLVRGEVSDRFAVQGHSERS